MSEFLGFAWELLAKVVYNVVAVVSSILNLLVFGWVEYFNIFMTYFTTFDLVGKIGAVILFAMLIAVPVLIVASWSTATASTAACIATTRPTRRSIARSAA